MVGLIPSMIFIESLELYAINQDEISPSFIDNKAH